MLSNKRYTVGIDTSVVVFTFGGADYELTRNLVVSTSSEICFLLV